MATATALVARDRAPEGLAGLDDATRLLSEVRAHQRDPTQCLAEIIEAVQQKLDASEGDGLMALGALRATAAVLPAGRQDPLVPRLRIDLLIARVHVRLGYYDRALRIVYEVLNAAARITGDFISLEQKLGKGGPCTIAELTIEALEALGCALPAATLSPTVRDSLLGMGRGLLGAYSSSATVTVYRRTPHTAAIWLSLLESRDPLCTKLNTLMFSAVAGSAPRPRVGISTSERAAA